MQANDPLDLTDRCDGLRCTCCAQMDAVRERAGIPGWWEGATPVPPAPTEGVTPCPACGSIDRSACEWMHP
jgi:hypothetical protein